MEINDAIATRDFEKFSAAVHPDVVWEHNLGGGSPEEGIYRGREAVVSLIQRIVEPFEYMRAEPEQMDELGGGAYLVRGELRSKHSTSTGEIVTPYEQRLEIRDGMLSKGSMRFGSL